MVQVNKRILVTGKCDNCKKKVEGTITAIGEKGKTGDWRGTGTCSACNTKVYLKKDNIKF